MKRLAAISCLGGVCGSYFLLRELPVPVGTGPAYQKLPHKTYDQHPNKHFLSKVPRTIGVIGGGSAGLVTAKVLSQQGFSVQVLEKGSRVGGVWADNYEDVGLQGPFSHYNMPDHQFPLGTPEYPKLEQVRDFIDAYVEKFALKPLISLNCEVVRVEQSAGGEWTVTLKDGSSRHFDFLVLSTGLFFQPHIPAIPGLDSFKGKALHSFDFRNAKEVCAGKKVVVIGGSKSGFDAMRLASVHGGHVTGIIRRRIWSVVLDQKLFGVSVMKLLLGRLSELLLPSPEEPVSWVQTWLSSLANLYWKTLSREIRKGLPESLQPQVDLRTQRYHAIMVRDKTVVSKVASGEIEVVTGEVEKVVPDGIVVHGRIIPADVLVFATGFSVNTLGFSEGSLWLYRGILEPTVRNFAAIGFVSSGFAQLKNNIQAVWLAEVLRGTVALPSLEAMRSEVAQRREVLEKAYSEFPATAAYAWPELTYYDTLLRDMGLQTRRKSPLLTDLLSLPEPLDYTSVVTHRV